MPKRLSLEEQKRRTWCLFGATGFTGKRIAKDIAFLMANDKISEEVVLCIAGRDEEKLESKSWLTLCRTGYIGYGTFYDADVKEWLHSEYEVPSRRIRMLEANVNDEQSLKYMAQASFLVMDAVGPYRLYGEPVVNACVNNSEWPARQCICRLQHQGFRNCLGARRVPLYRYQRGTRVYGAY